MSRFKTYTLEGSSQPGSFETKRVSIKLCKLFKLNYGLEETDGKLLLINSTTRELLESQLTWLAYEALHSGIVISSILFLSSTIYKKWKTFTCPDVNTRFGCWENLREFVQIANRRKTVFC